MADLHLRELKLRYSLAFDAKEQLVQLLIEQNTTSLSRMVTRRLRVVCRAQAKASIDLAYYSDGKPPEETLLIWLKSEQFRLDLAGEERTKIYDRGRTNGLRQIQNYVKATVKVLFIEGRLSVWKYQLNELQGKLETVPQFLDWWNESYVSVDDLEPCKHLSNLCRIEGTTDATTQLHQVPGLKLNIEMVQSALRILNGELARSKTVLSGVRDPRSPSQKKIDYLRCLAKHLTAQARLHHFVVLKRKLDAFAVVPR